MRSLKLEGNCVVGLVDVADPLPGPGEVIVDTIVSAVCGSEMHTYRKAGRETGNAGHEAAGIVSQLGEGVTDLRVGQRVGLSAVVGCGKCAHCAEGRFTWCEDRTFYGDMHAERILIAARGCHPLPEDVSWEAGVLLSGDGLGVPYHTSTRLSSGQAPDPTIETIAVFGVGPIGLGNTLVQSYLGRRVFAVDVSSQRLALARELGARDTIDAAKVDPVERIRALTSGRGADVCIEAAGRPETLRNCFSTVRTGGIVMMNGEQGDVELSPSADFIRRDIAAIGSWFYHFCEFQEMLALYRGGLQVERLITHTFAPEGADEAYREFAAARTGKVIIEWSDGQAGIQQR